MKKMICLAVLAMSSPAPVFATEFSKAENTEYCLGVAKLSKVYLQIAKKGVNPVDQLLADPEKLENAPGNAGALVLLIATDVWENRKVYNEKKAYASGYKICMDTERQ